MFFKREGPFLYDRCIIHALAATCTRVAVVGRVFLRGGRSAFFFFLIRRYETGREVHEGNIMRGKRRLIDRLTVSESRMQALGCGCADGFS